MIQRKAFLNILRHSLLGEMSIVPEQQCRLFSNIEKFKSERKQQLDYFQKERESQISPLLLSFSTKRNPSFELHRWNPLTLSRQRVIEWKNNLHKEVELLQQKYLPERHAILGSDLATAHFIVFRGGRVRFESNEEWIEKDIMGQCPQLPKKFVRGMYLHSVDASNTNIRYESLINFSNLNRLKWLSFRNCCYVDDWFLDRICAEYASTLEYLDVSECHSITEKGLSCIYKLRNLRTLKVSNIADTRSFELMCLLLEDSKQDLIIEGVKYLELEAKN